MRCYKCRSKDLEFLEGHKGGHFWYKVLLILLALFFVYLSTLFTFFIAGAIITAIILIALIVVDKANRNKTATKVVCRNCGRSFWLNQYK